jgi:hypothetical protein
LAHAREVPRVVLGLYDVPATASVDSTYIYDMAEMPLNHLGLIVEFRNLRQGVPDIAKRTDIRGLLIWLTDGRGLQVQKLTALVEAAAARNIPVVLMGNLPGGTDASGRAVTLADQNRLLAAIGLKSLGGFLPYTYDLKPAIKDASMVEFERKLPAVLPALEAIQPIDPQAQSFLAFDRKADEPGRSHAVVITAKGGYVAAGYTHYEDSSGEWSQWYLNPFAFFRRAYHTDGVPIPDTTTASGRRIFYSEIDGDGWNNVTSADAYKDRGIYSSEVILREIAQGYPDFPLAVAPIAGDLDPLWGGTLRSQEVARAFFRQPNVEPSTHTYTHPFDWSFYGPGYRGEDELPYFKKYARARIAPGFDADPTAPQRRLDHHYDAPRSYGDIPFNLKREIEGSAAYIDSFCPPGKRVRLLQWSGDTSPFEGALAAVMRAGLLNINGRDTRFDGEAPSYTAVSPIGKLVGQYRQISASHANENIYTDLWQGRFFGFRYLRISLANTEKPIRVKPIDVYYHMYSGERQASLTALKEILDDARRQELTPMAASQFAAIGQGFFTLRMTELAPQSWRIDQRGALNTLRFDDAATLQLDETKSSGAIGERLNGAVLYIALDPAAATPIVTLRQRGAAPSRPLLTDARWNLSNVTASASSVTMRAQGYGAGVMTWHMPRIGESVERWEARLDTGTASLAIADNQGFVRFQLPAGAEDGVGITIQRVEMRPALK